jgi:predicted ATPase
MKRSRFNNLSIQNFKAFGDMVDVPIRPITLIFGENSSGKSSILHSLLFLNQMQHQPQHQLADITYTQAGGNSVDLGGLPQLKYRRLNDRAMSFKVEYMYSRNALGFVVNSERSSNTSIKYNFTKNNILDSIQFLNDNLAIVNMNVVGITELWKHPAKFKFELDIDLDVLISILEFRPIRHKLMVYAVNNFVYGIEGDLFFEELLKEISQYKGQEMGIIVWKRLALQREELVNQKNILAVINSSIDFDIERVYIVNKNNEKSVKKELYSYDRNTNKEPFTFTEMREFSRESRNKFNLFFSLLWRIFTDEYNDYTNILEFSYLGPIRTIPTRNFDTLDTINRDPSTGSLSWEELVINDKARIQVNHWLSKFGTNKQIVTEKLIETTHLLNLISESNTKEQIESAIDALSKRYMLRFYDPQKNIYLSHRDLGVGISQVLPVIVNCVTNKESMVLIEQPELHLHPRLQGDLADLFIDTAIKGDQHNTYVIETHSEHIIRRVMRRIREDRNKSAGEPRITKDDVAILYVAAGPNGSTVTHLRLDDEGDLIDEWPNGFFEESFRDDMAGR